MVLPPCVSLDLGNSLVTQSDLDGTDFKRLEFITRKEVEVHLLSYVIDSTKHSICFDSIDRVYSILSLLGAYWSLNVRHNYVLGRKRYTRILFYAILRKHHS